jgi:hypothetical protein
MNGRKALVSTVKQPGLLQSGKSLWKGIVNSIQKIVSRAVMTAHAGLQAIKPSLQRYISQALSRIMTYK